jgi:lipopolysaccharide transport system permease protein
MTVLRVHTFYDMALALLQRDIASRYRGTLLGFVWPVLNPLLILAIFSFFYTVVLGARWPGVEHAPDYTLMLYCGIIVHGLFADCVTRAPQLILTHPTYVKRVIFPLEALGVVVVGSALFQTAINIAILLGFTAWQHGSIPTTAFWIPLVIAPFALVLLGFTWFLASLGAYFRDLQLAMPMVVLAAMFLSPIFYPISAIPAHLRPLLEWNPLTTIIEELRAVVLFGRQPDLVALALYTVAGVAVAGAGLMWFQRTRTGFAELV